MNLVESERENACVTERESPILCEWILVEESRRCWLQSTPQGTGSNFYFILFLC